MPVLQKLTTQGLFTQHQKTLRQFDRDLLLILDSLFTNLGNILNRGITVDDNIDCVELTYTTNALADTEDTIPHALGRIPVRFIVTDRNKGGIIYRGGTTFSSTNIFLKCSTPSTAVKVLIL